MIIKRRFHSPEFKLAAIRRIVPGCSVGALAEELGVERGLLYKWKARFEEEGPDGFVNKRRGRRPRGSAPPAPPDEPSETDVLSARIAELERLVGRQAMELDFFDAALREVGAPGLRNEGPGGTASTPSSGSGRARKAD